MNITKLLTSKKTLIITAITVIIVVILRFIFPPLPPTLINTSPTNHARNVQLDSSLTFEFDPLTDKERQNITITISPNITHSTEWDNNSLITTPSTLLNKNTIYSIQILYKNQEIAITTFTTNPYDQQDLEEQADLQAQDDLEFGVSWDKLNIDHPWYSSFPIFQDQYYIFYDSIARTFNIHLRNQPVSDAQQSLLLNQALDSIAKIGVSPEDLNYKLIID